MSVSGFEPPATSLEQNLAYLRIWVTHTNLILEINEFQAGLYIGIVHIRVEKGKKWAIQPAASRAHY